jgi:hypothetical protein
MRESNNLEDLGVDGRVINEVDWIVLAWEREK